jgi:hypothetical protein
MHLLGTARHVLPAEFDPESGARHHHRWQTDQIGMEMPRIGAAPCPYEIELDTE